MTAAATRAGVIMGTAAYMSPEQARGKSVDKRADIWAFGAVLYEMLTGRRAFEAEDVSLTLAEVMKSEPQWDALPSDVSPTLRTYLTRCLNKDPKKRVRDIGEGPPGASRCIRAPRSGKRARRIQTADPPVDRRRHRHRPCRLGSDTPRRSTRHPTNGVDSAIVGTPAHPRNARPRDLAERRVARLRRWPRSKCPAHRSLRNDAVGHCWKSGWSLRLARQ